MMRKNHQCLPGGIAGFALIVVAGTAGCDRGPGREQPAVGTIEPAPPERSMDDRTITWAVEAELRFDPGIRPDLIDVSVADGIVTLRGAVDNILERDRAARLASIVKGVRAVINRIAVEPPGIPSDRVLTRRVEHALDADPATEAMEIEVDAEDGEVRLQGDVDSYQERLLADRVVRGVKGVRAVQDDLEVAYALGRPDKEIREEVVANLRWDALVHDARIEVAVREGVVVLRGEVGSAAEKRFAAMDAWVAGVSRVDSTGLEVDPAIRDPVLRSRKIAERDDAAIRLAVEDALALDPRTKAFRISVEVEDGDVTLRGEVGNLKAERAALHDARNTVGVRRVRDRIKVHPAEPPGDRELEARVEKALARDPFVGARGIEVEANAGAVCLRGEVNSYFEKAQADDVAARVAGVVAVENDLRAAGTRRPLLPDPFVDSWMLHDFPWYDFRPAHGLRYPGDDRVKRRILDELWWSPFVDLDGVEVEVEDGIATLSGAVTDRTARRTAARCAIEGGAVGVINDLKLK